MTDFTSAMNDLITAIATDYREWTARSEYGDMARADKFAEELSVSAGRKYMKVTEEQVSDDGERTSSRVWVFVVKEDTNKFKKGDILMAAGYSSPATNKARGNIFEGYSVRWTGPNYL